jgi:alanyl-tRNA synthetase
MPLPTTTVTFPGGAVEGRSAVLAVHPLPDGRHGVVVEETPFHPLDHTWPDQPADTGTLGGLAVVDVLTAASPAQGGDLLVGEAIPVRRGDAEWHWHALHVVEEDPSALLGTVTGLAVDAERRAALSAAHTGCHLLALALNSALAARWRKEAREDALGNPDFDSLAMASSRIGTDASTDVYRLGKSLRKKGFTTDGLAEELPAIADVVNARLAGWLASAAPVRVDVPGPELTAHRKWTCALPEATAAISCGGTHIRGLGELCTLTTSLSLDESGTELTAVTTPKRA